MLDSRLSFSPALQHLYAEGVVTGKTGKRIPAAGGLSTINNLLAIKRLLDAHRPKRTMEIGLACGGSALLFGHYHKTNNSAEKSHTAIDAYQHDYDHAAIRELEDAGLEKYVEHVSELSQVALPRLWDEDCIFDFAYIDGSHEFDDVFVDFYFTDKVLSPGGLLLFDDCSNPKVRRVIRMISSLYTEYYEVVPRSEYRPADRHALIDFIAAKLGRVQLMVFRKTPRQTPLYFDFAHRGRRAQQPLSAVTNPYGNGSASEHIANLSFSPI